MAKITKANLLGNIRAIKKLPLGKASHVDKLEILINLLLSYIDDPDIINVIWQAGLDGGRSKSLEAAYKEANNPNKMK